MLVDILFDLDFNLNEFCSKTDEELVKLARNNKSATAVLLSRYSRLISIKSEIYAYTNTDSEDLRQEGLLALLKAIASFESERGVKFSTFAEVCIVNRMRTVSAGNSKKSFRSENIDDIIEADELSVDETPESIYLYKEFITELSSGIQSALSPTELKVFNLCMQGLSYRSIAEKLGVSEKTVDNAVQRARKKIRALISKLNMTV